MVVEACTCVPGSPGHVDHLSFGQEVGWQDLEGQVALDHPGGHHAFSHFNRVSVSMVDFSVSQVFVKFMKKM